MYRNPFSIDYLFLEDGVEHERNEVDMNQREFIELNDENIEEQHICCAISDKKSKQGYLNKKKWLKTQFKNGYHFRKLDVRGKVFIEYQPAKEAWVPLDADGYMLINCFWVSGKFKNQGYGKSLLESCLEDAKEMKGTVVITGDKKKPFMGDPKFFAKHGFECVDQAKPHFQLWCKKNDPQTPSPSFLKGTKSGECPEKKGIVAYYSSACPFTEFYIAGELKAYAEAKKIPFKGIKITSKKDAKKLPLPWVINSVFYKGKFFSHEMKVSKKLDTFIEENAKDD